jgi:predicted dehydrogenase
MITNDLLLPSLYHLQRTGVIRNIDICALDSSPLKALANSWEFREAFPGQDFTPHPTLREAPEKKFPELYKEVIAAMAPGNMVVVAMPDHRHFEVVREALHHEQNVLCVKPLVLKYEQAVEIEKLAAEKGRLVGIEYHKRFDRRSLVAKRGYARGEFGAFVLGEAKLIEPYYYRFSNFHNWFTCDHTDALTYVGCHYVDLVYFIIETGSRLRGNDRHRVIFKKAGVDPGSYLGVHHAHGGQAVGLSDDFNVAEDIGAFLLEDAANLDGQQADFSIGVWATTKFQKVPPGAAVAGDEDFGFAGVGKDGTRRLASPLTAVARGHHRVLPLNVLGGSFR